MLATIDRSNKLQREVNMRTSSMNKASAVIVISLFLAGCAATITPGGVYIEPLAPSIVVGPPIVVAPPPHIVLRPLPPVYYYHDRPSLYHHHDLYYYRYGRDWYYGEHEKGPWHRLPQEYYPPHERERR
jgi:hypothetical protein